MSQAARPPAPVHKVVAVGLTTLDVVHRVERHPAVNEKVTSLRTDVAAGGPAANAAITAAALGAPTVLLTALGDGPLAAFAADELARHDVEVVDATHASGGAPTGRCGVSSVVVVDSTGDRTVVSRSGADIPIAIDRADVRACIDATVAGAAIVLADGHHAAMAAVAIERATCLVLLDAGSWRESIAPLLRWVTYAVCSSVFRMPGTRTVEESAAALRRAGVTAVAVTDGPGPIRWWDASGGGVMAVPSVDVRDTLGAGDVFHGAAARALASGTDFVSSLEFARDVASVRVTHAGPRAWLDDPRLAELARRFSDAHSEPATR